MSGPKHTPTPGPWRLLATEGETVVVGPDDEYVAFVSSGEVPDDPDGLLAAAAPRLAAELAAWRAWAERWGRDIETSVSVSPITHNELVERLAATNAALREAGVEP